MATRAQAAVAPNPGSAMQISYGIRKRGLPMQVFHVVDLLDRAFRGRTARPH